MELIFFVALGIIIYLIDKNIKLKEEKKRIENQIVYNKFEKKKTITLIRKLNKIQKEYDKLLSMARRRWEKDGSPKNIEGQKHYILGTEYEVDYECAKYMTADEYESKLYNEYNDIRYMLSEREDYEECMEEFENEK